MNARQKLNVAYVNGALWIAGIAGFFTGSWLVLAIVLSGSMVLGFSLGNIRPRKRRS